MFLGRGLVVNGVWSLFRVFCVSCMGFFWVWGLG